MTTMIELTQQWKEAKNDEEAAKQRRIGIESYIYELVQKDLPEKGIYTTETNMKIVTGFTESWDDESIQAAYQQWPVEKVKFPFAPTWKPDGKAITVIRDSIPALYKLIQPALTIKPKKPAFSVKE